MPKSEALAFYLLPTMRLSLRAVAKYAGCRDASEGSSRRANCSLIAERPHSLCSVVHAAQYMPREKPLHSAYHDRCRSCGSSPAPVRGKCGVFQRILDYDVIRFRKPDYSQSFGGQDCRA